MPARGYFDSIVFNADNDFRVTAIGATGGLIGLLVDSNRKSRRVTTVKRVTTFFVQ